MATYGSLYSKFSQLAHDTGSLSSLLLSYQSNIDKGMIISLIVSTTSVLIYFYSVFAIDPIEAIYRKMAMNQQRYDTKTCRNTAHIEKWNSSKPENWASCFPDLLVKPSTYNQAKASFVNNSTHFSDAIQTFAIERNWSHQYTLPNLAMAIVAETGELAQLFQWIPSSTHLNATPMEKRNQISDEISDVLIYLFHLCRVLDVSSPVTLKLHKSPGSS